MTTKLGKEFDIQDYLINTENNPEAFFKACVEEDLGDGSLVRRALGEMVKAKGMVQLAKETGLSKQCLYRALSPEGSPKFETIFRISKALKLRFRLIEPDLNFRSPLRLESSKSYSVSAGALLKSFVRPASQNFTKMPTHNAEITVPSRSPRISWKTQ